MKIIQKKTKADLAQDLITKNTELALIRNAYTLVEQKNSNQVEIINGLQNRLGLDRATRQRFCLFFFVMGFAGGVLATALASAF